MLPSEVELILRLKEAQKVQEASILLEFIP